MEATEKKDFCLVKLLICDLWWPAIKTDESNYTEKDKTFIKMISTKSPHLSLKGFVDLLVTDTRMPIDNTSQVKWNPPVHDRSRMYDQSRKNFKRDKVSNADTLLKIYEQAIDKFESGQRTASKLASIFMKGSNSKECSKSRAEETNVKEVETEDGQGSSNRCAQQATVLTSSSSVSGTLPGFHTTSSSNETSPKDILTSSNKRKGSKQDRSSKKRKVSSSITPRNTADCQSPATKRRRNEAKRYLTNSDADTTRLSRRETRRSKSPVASQQKQQTISTTFDSIVCSSCSETFPKNDEFYYVHYPRCFGINSKNNSKLPQSVTEFSKDTSQSVRSCKVTKTTSNLSLDVHAKSKCKKPDSEKHTVVNKPNTNNGQSKCKVQNDAREKSKEASSSPQVSDSSTSCIGGIDTKEVQLQDNDGICPSGNNFSETLLGSHEADDFTYDDHAPVAPTEFISKTTDADASSTPAEITSKTTDADASSTPAEIPSKTTDADAPSTPTELISKTADADHPSSPVEMTTKPTDADAPSTPAEIISKTTDADAPSIPAEITSKTTDADAPSIPAEITSKTTDAEDPSTPAELASKTKDDGDSPSPANLLYSRTDIDDFTDVTSANLPSGKINLSRPLHTGMSSNSADEFVQQLPIPTDIDLTDTLQERKKFSVNEMLERADIRRKTDDTLVFLQVIDLKPIATGEGNVAASSRVVYPVSKDYPVFALNIDHLDVVSKIATLTIIRDKDAESRQLQMNSLFKNAKTALTDMCEYNQTRMDFLSVDEVVQTIITPTSSLKLKRADIACLNGTHWLNGEIIDAYLCLLYKNNGEGKRILPIDNLMLPSYLRKGNDVPSRKRIGAYSNVDLTGYDLVYVPINVEKKHWILVVVDIINKKIQSYDSCMGNNEKHLQAVLQYMQEYHELRGTSHLQKQGWKLEDVKDITMQKDSYQCGVLVCMFAKRLKYDESTQFPYADVESEREKIKFQLLTGELLK